MGETFLTKEFSGDGSPEGVVRAIQGAIYINLTGGGRWLKTTGPHLNTGWELQFSGDIVAEDISDATTFGQNILQLNPASAGYITVTDALGTAALLTGTGQVVGFVAAAPSIKATDVVNGLYDVSVTPGLTITDGLITVVAE